MRTPPSPAQRGLSRRSAIAGAGVALAAVTLAGCDWGPDDAAPSGSSGGVGGASDPDVDLAVVALAELTVARGVADRAAHDRPSTRRLRDLRATYAEQVTILGGDPATSASAPAPSSVGTAAPSSTPSPTDALPGGPATVADALAAARTLQQSLVSHAGAAVSGDLARTFAAMAAGIAQALAVQASAVGAGAR